MAATNITFNHNLQPHGSELARYLNDVERNDTTGPRLIAAMQHMIDGDGSDASHFAAMTAAYGFPSNAVAKTAWDELNSHVAKQETNSSVTDVKAAKTQLLAKFGIV